MHVRYQPFPAPCAIAVCTINEFFVTWHGFPHNFAPKKSPGRENGLYRIDASRRHHLQSVLKII
jgi:hypothetical protein